MLRIQFNKTKLGKKAGCIHTTVNLLFITIRAHRQSDYLTQQRRPRWLLNASRGSALYFWVFRPSPWSLLAWAKDGNAPI